MVQQTGGGIDFEKYGYQWDNEMANISAYLTLSGDYGTSLLLYTFNVVLTSLSKPLSSAPLSSITFTFRDMAFANTNQVLGIRFSNERPVYISRFPASYTPGKLLYDIVFPRDSIYGDNTYNWP